MERYGESARKDCKRVEADNLSFMDDDDSIGVVLVVSSLVDTFTFSSVITTISVEEQISLCTLQQATEQLNYKEAFKK